MSNRTQLEGLASAARAKARLKAQANPKPVTIPNRRDTVEEMVEHVSAGRDRSKVPQTRALTRVERMHAAGMVSYEEAQTASVLRNRFIKELGGSEGVASYEQSSGDQRAGWEVAQKRAAGILDRNRSNRTRLAGLMAAMCSVENEEGARVFDADLAFIVVTASIQVVDAPQLGAIGKKRSAYSAEKQSQAAGGTIIREALRRGAAHLGFLRWAPYSPERSWRVAGMEVVR